VKLRAEAQIMLQNNFAIPAACCPRAGRPGSRRQQPQGRHARQLRHRLHRRLSLRAVRRRRAAAVGGKLSGNVAPWISVTVIGVVGIVLTIWRAKSTDRPPLVA
jgi:hypothetical protein